jgi:integrase
VVDRLAPQHDEIWPARRASCPNMVEPLYQRLFDPITTPCTNALWISSTTGRRMTTKNLGTLISKITFETLGVDVSPHLFRTAAASTAAIYGGKTPHLASALLNHTDPRVTEEHYNRASTMSAATAYTHIIS